jgi:hypothetical protein
MNCITCSTTITHTHTHNYQNQPTCLLVMAASIDWSRVYVARYNPYASLDDAALDRIAAQHQELQQRAGAVQPQPSTSTTAPSTKPTRPSSVQPDTHTANSTSTSSVSSAKTGAATTGTTTATASSGIHHGEKKLIRSDIEYCKPYNPYGSLGQVRVSPYWQRTLIAYST